jgi:hypothetical protein
LLHQVQINFFSNVQEANGIGVPSLAPTVRISVLRNVTKILIFNYKENIKILSSIKLFQPAPSCIIQ